MHFGRRFSTPSTSSYGSLLVIAATVCWGFENNCTRNIASKNTYEIVVLKGVFSGLGALAIAVIRHEAMPSLAHVAAVLALGFVAYGLSIFLYVRAQNTLGAGAVVTHDIPDNALVFGVPARVVCTTCGFSEIHPCGASATPTSLR